MKGLCYIALIIGFFIFYQQNPLYAIVIIVLIVGVYIFFKHRSSRGNIGIIRFLSGRDPQHDNKIDDLFTLMMLQQLLDSNHNKNDLRREHNNNNDKNSTDKIKKEILGLLEKD
ncbi:MAG: hypothetical protein ACFFDH_10645 [Promethearchaeota archaeon]